MIRMLRNGLLVTFILVQACSPQVIPPKGPSWEERAKEASELPEVVAKKAYPPGTVVAVERGSQAPFSGVLMTEDRARDVAELRIAYDELVVVSAANRRLYLVTARVADAELTRADERLKAAQPTWWDRNAMVVGFVAGIFATGAFTVGVLAATDNVR